MYHGSDDWQQYFYDFNKEELGLVANQEYLEELTNYLIGSRNFILAQRNPIEFMDKANEYINQQEASLEELSKPIIIPEEEFLLGGGRLQIEKYEDENIYIPPIQNCVLNLLAHSQYSKFNLSEDDLYKLLVNFASSKKYIRAGGFISIKNYYKIIDSFNIKDIKLDYFQVCKWLKTKWVTINRARGSTVDRIALINIGNDNTRKHTILLKKNKREGAKKYSTYEEIKEKIILSDSIDITKQVKKGHPNLPKSKVSDEFYVFDFEVVMSKEKNKRSYVYACGFTKVNMNDEDYVDNVDAVIYYGDNCIMEMLDYIIKDYDKKDVQLFAHNGGRFDNIFFKTLINIKFKKQISTSTLKSLTFEYKGKNFTLKDSLQFMCNFTLKKIGEDICTKYKKIEISHNDITKENYLEKIDTWKPYLRLDVLVLAEGCYKFEKTLRNGLSLSMLNVLGTPGLAGKLMDKSTFISETFTTIDINLRKFIRASIYGGRIIHNYKYFEDVNGMICLDCNSLYPAAMCLFPYPIGRCIIVKNLEEIKNNLNSLSLEDLAILEVDIKIPRGFSGVLPVRVKDYGNIFPYGTVRGIWTSIDLMEAIRFGAVVINVYKGVMWENKTMLFENYIHELYAKRLELKKVDNKLEVVYKLLMNSSYGKMLESISTSVSFNDNLNVYKTLISEIKLPNGQYERKYREDYEIKCSPHHLGAFVLSYSRVLVNKFIELIGMENVYYGDTDSLYVPNNIIKQKKIATSSELGWFKNDYGNKLIVKAYFIDYKRYLIKFNDGYFSCKFVGLSSFETAEKNKVLIVSNNLVGDWDYHENMFIRLLSGEKYKSVQERWEREKDNVTINPNIELNLVSGKKKRNWDTAEERILNKYLGLGKKIYSEPLKMKDGKIVKNNRPEYGRPPKNIEIIDVEDLYNRKIYDLCCKSYYNKMHYIRPFKTKENFAMKKIPGSNYVRYMVDGEPKLYYCVYKLDDKCDLYSICKGNLLPVNRVFKNIDEKNLFDQIHGVKNYDTCPEFIGESIENFIRKLVQNKQAHNMTHQKVRNFFHKNKEVAEFYISDKNKEL